MKADTGELLWNHIFHHSCDLIRSQKNQGICRICQRNDLLIWELNISRKGETRQNWANFLLTYLERTKKASWLFNGY
jgi:hypothetical protein